MVHTPILKTEEPTTSFLDQKATATMEDETMMEEPPDIKRRRISAAADSSTQGISCLSNLPSGILAHSASFLASPSRALFAVALDGSFAASPNERISAIVGNEWDILDF